MTKVTSLFVHGFYTLKQKGRFLYEDKNKKVCFHYFNGNHILAGWYYDQFYSHMEFKNGRYECVKW